MAKTIASVTYTMHSSERDVVTFRDYTSDKAQLAFKRTAPKRIKDFPGMEKTEVKYTLQDPVLGPIGIITISSSIRADANDAVRNTLAGIAPAVTADAAYVPLLMNQQLPLNA